MKVDSQKEIDWEMVGQAFGVPNRFEEHEIRLISVVRQITLNIIGYIPVIGTLKAVIQGSVTLLNPYSNLKGRGLGICIRNGVELSSAGLILLPVDILITIRRMFQTALVR